MIHYTVESGDTLQHVVVKFNCDIRDITKENKISPFQKLLYKGQILKIPQISEIDKIDQESTNKINTFSHHEETVDQTNAIGAGSGGTYVYCESDNVSENKFFKVKASRIIDYVSLSHPGILLITQQFLIFDLESVFTQDNINEIVNAEDPIQNFALSISLDSVLSLKTYSKLSNFIKEKQIIIEGHTHSHSSHPMTFMDEKDTIYLIVKAVPLSDNYKRNSLTFNNKTSPKSSKLYIFGVSTERIEEMYSFLLSSVKTAHNKTGTEIKESAILQSRLQEEFVVDNNQHGIITDALVEFEHVKFKPQFKNGRSVILLDSMLEDLVSALPLNLNGSNLSLVYRTGTHGYSLGTIYRKMKSIRSAAVLLIKDSSNTIFGAYMSDPFHISTHYYGNGETFVFHWKPNFMKYEWTRDNSFFMKGDLNCFSIGAKSGHSAIWFEDTLKFGRSEPTDTFDNPTLCGDCEEIDQTKSETLIKSLAVDKSILTSKNVLSKGYFFVIDCLEIWVFSM